MQIFIFIPAHSIRISLCKPKGTASTKKSAPETLLHSHTLFFTDSEDQNPKIKLAKLSLQSLTSWCTQCIHVYFNRGDGPMEAPHNYMLQLGTLIMKVILLYRVYRLQCSIKLTMYSIWFREYYRSKTKEPEGED